MQTKKIVQKTFFIITFLLFALQAHAQNLPPTVAAGPDQTVNEGSLVQLSGAVSDPDSSFFVFSWSQLGAQNITLSDTNALNPTFTAPSVAGGAIVLTFELFATDGVNFVTDTVDIIVSDTNVAPLANAGNDQTLAAGTSVQLSAANSFDADGDAISFSWSQVSSSAGLTYVLSDASLVNPSFQSSEPDVVVFQVSVSDGLLSSTDIVTITIEAANQIPLSNAGGDQNVNTGDLVTLDGTASSDADGDVLSYSWSQVSGPIVALDLTNPALPTFQAPSSAEVLIFDLVVNDGKDSSLVDSITVTVQGALDAPLCDKARPSRRRIRRANHKMAKIKIKGVYYNDDEGEDDDDKHEAEHHKSDDVHTNIIITGISQDEPTYGLGRRDVPIDGSIQERIIEKRWGTKQKDRAYIRKERDRNGNGRVYEIYFRAVNADTGAFCEGSVQVCVPKGKKSKTCIDDGQSYDSLN